MPIKHSFHPTGLSLKYEPLSFHRPIVAVLKAWHRSAVFRWDPFALATQFAGSTIVPLANGETDGTKFIYWSRRRAIRFSCFTQKENGEFDGRKRTVTRMTAPIGIENRVTSWKN